MNIVIVEPGPSHSVQDVHDGWLKGLRQAGANVSSFPMGPCAQMYENAWYYQEVLDCWLAPYDAQAAMILAGDMLLAHVLKGWPDVVLVVYGRWLTIPHIDIIRRRGIKVVYLFTESPYEDNIQANHSHFADLAIVNDPTNLGLYDNAYYQPHCYDPDVHYPGGSTEHDFAFVGTGFDSRIEFFESVDWQDTDARFWGNWPDITDGPLLPFFDGHHPAECLDNPRTADLYRASKMTANLYRREANRPDLEKGWAMGPREVEAAACGTFMLRDPRPESDETLHMLPSFSSAGEFSEQLHWWLAHDAARETCADKARSAIAGRTFENAARRLLSTLDQ